MALYELTANLSGLGRLRWAVSAGVATQRGPEARTREVEGVGSGRPAPLNLPAALLLALMFLPGAVFGSNDATKERYSETVTLAAGKTVSFEMILVPGGTFLMGSPETESGRKADEGPVRQVRLSPYYLAATETTMELFLGFYRETVSSAVVPVMPDGVDTVTGPTPVYGDMTMGRSLAHPAIGMTWLNAQAFCRWLGAKTGKPYRLPTEAEWEYACRAGSDTVYGFGNDATQLADYAWFDDNSLVTPHAVGTRRPNPWGFFDLLGNVAEWVQDIYAAGYEAATPGVAVTDPTGPAEGKVHVARGGGYRSPAAALRCAARDAERSWWRAGDPQLPKSRWWLPSMDQVGLRVACSAAEADPNRQ